MLKLVSVPPMLCTQYIGGVRIRTPEGYGCYCNPGRKIQKGLEYIAHAMILCKSGGTSAYSLNTLTPYWSVLLVIAENVMLVYPPFWPTAIYKSHHDVSASKIKILQLQKTRLIACTAKHNSTVILCANNPSYI